MKKRTSFCLALLLLISCAGFSQTSRSANATATKSWSAFWSQFSAAVNKRDRVALKRMISNRFDSGGDGFYTPDRWIRFLDKVKGWPGVEKSVVSGTRVLKSSNGRPQRTSNTNYLIFEFGADGRWRWVGVWGD